MKGKLKHCVNIFSTGFLILSIILLLSCVLIALQNKENICEGYLLGVKPYYVTSNSMHPAIEKSSIVIAYKAPLSKINVGDIILVKEDNKYVVRRVTQKLTQDCFITKADNRPFADTFTLNSENYQAKIY